MKILHDHDVLALLLEITVLLGEDMDRDLTRRGLTRSRATVVWFVAAQGPMTQRALAEALQVSPRNVTGLVDGLEASGFVRREPHPTDRRATLVGLTAAGEAAAADLQRANAQLAQQLFAGFPERRLADLHRSLARIRDTLHDLLADEQRDRTPMVRDDVP